MKTSFSMLKEVVSLLKEIRFTQCKAGDCVCRCLDQVIQTLEDVRVKDYSEPEVAAIILNELGYLFSEFPEIQKEFTRLAEL